MVYFFRVQLGNKWFLVVCSWTDQKLLQAEISLAFFLSHSFKNLFTWIIYIVNLDINWQNHNSCYYYHGYTCHCTAIDFKLLLKRIAWHLLLIWFYNPKYAEYWFCKLITCIHCTLTGEIVRIKYFSCILDSNLQFGDVISSLIDIYSEYILSYEEFEWECLS